MNKLYRREIYLNKLRPLYDETGTIKFITGVLGCGKTTLIEIIIEELIEKGVPEDNIISINFNKRPYKGINTAQKLIDIVDRQSIEISGEKYLFLDELLNVNDFERALNEFTKDSSYSIFVTSSNGYTTKPKHVRRLKAHYITVEMLTLSFQEYLDMKKFYGKKVSDNLQEELTKYMMEGGFPYTVINSGHDNMHAYSKKVLEDIFEKIIRKNKRIKNRELFFAIRKYVINSFGKALIIKDMQEFLSETLHMSVRKETLYNYLQILEDARIVYKCQRFDISERRIIKGKERYYLPDLSFYYAVDLYNTLDIETSLKNVIYNYSLLWDYKVAIGRVKNNKSEIDFVLEDSEMDYVYVQVANYINSNTRGGIGTSKEEEYKYKPLENIRDFYPKYVLTLDKALHKRSGIKHKNIVDFIENCEVF